MKNIIKINHFFKLSLMSVIIIGAIYLIGSCTSVRLPNDAQPSCPISLSEFRNWFRTGNITLNGAVTPANSLEFQDDPNCGFYEWSERMFLWLTTPSQVNPLISGFERTFTSPEFYTVSPTDANGNRSFVPNSQSSINSNMNLRFSQKGFHGLPVVLEQKSLKLFEVVDPEISPNGKQLVFNRLGRKVELERIVLENNTPVFFDNNGTKIENARPIIPQDLEGEPVVQRFQVNQVLVYLAASGNAVEVEQGQANFSGEGGEVLMSRNGSLVYYLTTVNATFAYFRAMLGANVPDGTEFPTTQGDLDEIIDFANSRGKILPNPNALAVEVKTSWIEADKVDDVKRYITITATVPNYNTSNADLWVRNGTKTVKLAMVGMHVVGSTHGHPEMIWATFEHISNVPNAEYNYNSTNPPNPKTVPQNVSDGFWLFCDRNATSNFNIAHMRMRNNGDIERIPPFHITSSNTLRRFPWGDNPTEASSNTQVISVNNRVRSMLANGDVRSNYILIGATWTAFGVPPEENNAQVGTNRLSNSTMETYQMGTNCFSCHRTNTTAVSHTFNGVTQLIEN